jgi:hypothetical protein
VSLQRLWAFLAVGLPVLAVTMLDLPSVDLTYHLRAGAQILDTRAIPSVDTWTFTASGLPWVDQQWGAQVLLAAAFRIGGWTGLVLFKAALVLTIFVCLFEIARRRGLQARLAALLTLAAFGVAAPTLSLRPQMIGMALFAIVLLVVADRRAHPRLLWAVPVIVLIWANIHGSFFLGLVVLGLAWLEDIHDRIEQPGRVLRIAIVAALAACVTPIGPWVWSYAVGLSTNSQITNQVAEWRSTSLRDEPGLVFFASVVGLVAIMARRGRVVAWPTLLSLLAFFVIGAYAVRGLAWWPLAVVPVIAGVLVVDRARDPDRQLATEAPRMRRINIGIAALIVVTGVIFLPLWRPLDTGTNAPAGAVGYAPSGITGALRNLGRPGDRVFNPQPWGSWFEFAEPDLAVAIDSRIELFPAEVWDGYGDVAAGVEGWQAQLDQWGVTIAVVMAADDGLGARLSAAGWRTAYSDRDGSIFLAPGRS